MASKKQLLVEILGDAKHFLKSIGEAEQSSGKLGKTLGGVALAAGGAFAVKELADFGKASVDTFTNVATETGKLQRITGGTAEEMSRLRFAGTQVGIGADQLAASFVKFSKAGLGPAKDELAKMGVSFYDANGKAKPFKDQVEAVATKFKAMGPGAATTAEAVKLFGRAGADLLPILLKGGDGIESLMKKSDQFGLTLSQDGVSSAKKYKAEQRDMTAAMDGLKVTIGGALMPIFSGFIGFVNSTAQPVLRAIGTAFKDHIVPAAKMLWEKMQPVVDVIKSLVEHVKDFFKDNPQALFAGIATVVGGVLVGAFWALASAVIGAMSPIILVIAAIALLAIGVVYAYNHFTWFRDGVDAVVKFVSGLFESLVGWVQKHWDKIKEIIMGVWNAVKQEVKGALEIVTGLFDFFKDLFTGHWSKLWQDVKDIFTGLWDFVVGWFKGLPALLLSLLSAAGGWLVDIGAKILNGLWDGIKSGAESVWGWFKKLPGNILDAIGDLGKTLWNAGKGLMQGLWDGVKSVGSAALDVAKGIANGVIGFINDKMIHGFNSGLDIIWSKIPFTSGKFPWHVPDIPKFHGGGVFSGPSEGLALLRNGEGIFTPEQMAALGAGAGGSGGGASTIINLTVQAGVGNPIEIGATVVDCLRQYERVNSAAWRAA